MNKFAIAEKYKLDASVGDVKGFLKDLQKMEEVKANQRLMEHIAKLIRLIRKATVKAVARAVNPFSKRAKSADLLQNDTNFMQSDDFRAGMDGLWKLMGLSEQYFTDDNIERYHALESFLDEMVRSDGIVDQTMVDEIINKCLETVQITADGHFIYTQGGMNREIEFLSADVFDAFQAWSQDHVPPFELSAKQIVSNGQKFFIADSSDGMLSRFRDSEKTAEKTEEKTAEKANPKTNRDWVKLHTTTAEMPAPPPKPQKEKQKEYEKENMER